MAQIEILTAQEIDRFMSRLAATVGRAGEADALEKAIAQVVRGTLSPAKAAAVVGRAGRPPARPAGRPGRPRGPRRPPIDQAAILRELGKSKDGLSSTQLATRLGEKSRQRMLATLDRMREAGQVKLSGERRFARWHAA